jgi:hypothetical protein
MGSLDLFGAGKSSSWSHSPAHVGPTQSRREELEFSDSNNNFHWSGVGDNSNDKSTNNKASKDAAASPSTSSSSPDLRSQIAEEFQDVVDRMQSVMNKLRFSPGKRAKTQAAGHQQLSKSGGATPGATLATPMTSYWSKLVKRMRSNLGFRGNQVRAPLDGAGDNLNYIEPSAYKSNKNKKVPLTLLTNYAVPSKLLILDLNEQKLNITKLKSLKCSGGSRSFIHLHVIFAIEVF